MLNKLANFNSQIDFLLPPIVAELFRRERPTFSHCVPTILQMVLQCPEARELDHGWLRMTKTAARSWTAPPGLPGVM